MTRMQRFWIPAGIVLLTLAMTAFPLPLNAKAPAQKAGKPAKPQMQCPMMAGMKGMKFFADSPAVLLSRAEELGLTDKQKKRLERIQEKARRKAHEVLTAEQQKTLKDAPKGRLSMMDLAMTRMKTMMAGKKPHGMMCPTCMKMMMQKMQSRKKQK